MVRLPDSRGAGTIAVLGLLMVFSSFGLGPAHAAPIPPAPDHPPTFTFLQPNGGENITGGTYFTIGWRVAHDADASLFTTVRLSIDSGVTFTFFVTGAMFPTGNASWTWPVPVVFTKNARIQVCAFARDGGQACVASARDFEIFASGSYVWLISPADGATNVPRDGPLVLAAKDINTSSVQFSITPPVALALTWLNNDTLLWMQNVIPLAWCTRYTVTVQAFDVFGRSEGPYTWTFTTTCGPPFVVSTIPSDGSTGIALSADIVITFSDPMNTSSVTFTIAPSFPLTVSWSNGDTVLTLSHPTVPFPSCTVFWISVDGKNVNGYWLLPGPRLFSFSLTCNGPYITATVPYDGAVDVGLTANIDVWFSADMDTPTVSWSISPSIGLIAVWPGPANVTLYPNNSSFAPCTTYTIHITGYDLSGLPLVAGPVPNPWSFTTACTNPGPPVLLSPGGGERWAGGSTHDIAWTQSGPPPIPWELSWTTGGNWTPIASGGASPGTVTFGWAVPSVDTTTARVRVCTGPGYQQCAMSGDFTIDSTPPVIVSTIPSDGEMDVDLAVPIVVTFSEPMDRDSMLFVFSWGGPPPPFPFNRTWTANDTVLTFTHANPLPACTAINASIEANDTAGNPLTQGPVANPWNWTTRCGSSIDLSSPVGGESWTGGSGHAVTFILHNGDPSARTFTVDAVYRYANGTQSGAIGSQDVTVAGFSAQTGQFAWTVPRIDATDVIVNLTATSAKPPVWAESRPFEIDSTPPIVRSFAPSGARMPLNPTLTVSFSEPLAAPQTSPLSIVPAVSWSLQWGAARDAFTAVLSGTQSCTMYTATVGGNPSDPLRDDSDPGNAMVPVTWSFTTACVPTVSLLAPDGGQDWTGGSVHTIQWTSDDRDDPMLTATLLFSLDGGATFPGMITTLTVPIGLQSYTWTVPKVDSTEVVVRVVMTDAEGNTATDSSTAPFQIDSTSPAVLASVPSSGGAGAKTTRDIWFVFTEKIDRASFQAAFAISPNPGGLVFQWFATENGGDLLVVAHSPFKSKTTYAVTYATTAKDVSDPGNHPLAPLRVAFTTQPPPNVTPPVAKAVGHNQVEVGVPQTLDGSQSTGNLVQYVWRITDNQDRYVAVFAGAVVQYTFHQNGRYHVTLIVTDANGAAAEDTIEIAVTSSASDGIILATFAAALIATTETGRATLFSWFLFPMYVRRKRNEVLEHQTRGMILGYVLVHPGDTYTDIKRNLMLPNGTLTYHLNVLEREGLLRSQVRGPRKLFYSREARVPEDGGGLHEVQVRMYRAIQAVPGLAVKDIAGALGITSQHALYHVRALAAQGYVRLERRGIHLRCFAEEGKAPPLHEDSRSEDGG